MARRRIALELSVPNPHPSSHARPEPILRLIYPTPFDRVVMDIPDLLRELAVSRTLRSKPPPFCQNRGRLVASLTLDRMGASRTAHRVSTRLATYIFMLTSIQSSAESLGGRHNRYTCLGITTHANTSNRCFDLAWVIASTKSCAILRFIRSGSRRWQEKVTKRTPPGISRRRIRFRGGRVSSMTISVHQTLG